MAELGGARWREYRETRRYCGQRPERERLRLLKPYSSLALDGRELSWVFRELSWTVSELSCAVSALSWAVPGLSWTVPGLSLPGLS